MSKIITLSNNKMYYYIKHLIHSDTKKTRYQVILFLLTFVSFQEATPYITSDAGSSISLNSEAPSNSLARIQPFSSVKGNNASLCNNDVFSTENDNITRLVEQDLRIVEPCRAKSISVNRNLNVVNWQKDEAWINLETESITILDPNGIMEIEIKTQPYYAKERYLITLTGDKINFSNPRHKAITVNNGGLVEKAYISDGTFYDNKTVSMLSSNLVLDDCMYNRI